MKRTLVAVLAFLSLTGLTWRFVGPGSGTYNVVVEGPRGVTIACSDAGGLYRSTDRGRTWTPLGKVQSNPLWTRPNTTLAAFSPRTDSAVCLVGAEGLLMRSVNDGLSFHAVSNDTVAGAAPVEWPAGVCFTARGVAGTDTCYYAMHRTFSDTVAFQLKRSVDSGLTWANTGSAGLPLQGLRVLKVLCKPNNAQHVFLVSGSDNFIDQTRNTQTAVNHFRVFRSLDAGANWTDLGAPDSVMDFILHPWKPDTAFVTTWTGDQRANTHVCKSWIVTGLKTVAGATWTQLSTHGGSIMVVPHRNEQPALLVCDTNRDSPSQAETGVWQAQVPWTSWTRIQTGVNFDRGWNPRLKTCYGVGTRGWANSITTSQYDSLVYWRATSQFVFRCDTTGQFLNAFADRVRSTEPLALGAGNEWWIGRGVDGAIPTCLATSGAWLYAGWWDQGFARSNDGGLSWQAVNDSALGSTWLGGGGDCSTMAADPWNGHVWIGFGSGKTSNSVIRSTANGEPGSWAATAGLTAGLLSGMALDPLSVPNNRTLFVVSTGNLFKSVDDGQNWTSIWNAGADSLRTCAVSGSTVWVGGPTGLFKATDGGVNAASFTRVNPIAAGWTPAVTGNNYEFRYRGVQRIVIGPRGNVYAVISDNVSAGAGFGVFRTTDGGTTWTNVHSGFHDRDFLVTRDDVWYVTSSTHTSNSGAHGGLGVLVSYDQGATWTNITANGMSWFNCWAMAIDPLNASWLVVAAPGSGLFRADLLSGMKAPVGRGRR